MDILPTLIKQHRDLEELFRAVRTARTNDRKARLFEELSDMLVAHVGLEEHLLRMVVGRAPRSSGLLEQWEGRLRVERLITMLAPMDVTSSTFEGELARLLDLVDGRVAHEESRLFPTLARYLTPPARPSVAASRETDPVEASAAVAHAA